MLRSGVSQVHCWVCALWFWELLPHTGLWPPIDAVSTQQHPALKERSSKHQTSRTGPMETRPHSSFHVSAFPLRPSHRQPKFGCSHTQLCDTWLWEEMWRKCLADLHHRESSTCLEKLLSNRSFVDFRPKPFSATYENSQKKRCSTVDQNPESSALWASPTASFRTPVMSLIQIEARLLARPHNRELSLSSLISVLAKVLRFAPRFVLLPSPTTPTGPGPAPAGGAAPRGGGDVPAVGSDGIPPQPPPTLRGRGPRAPRAGQTPRAPGPLRDSEQRGGCGPGPVRLVLALDQSAS
ncbi:uncharacterized protein LOC113951383 [Corapipo altera]|uniref:uncharacterized protein LOC113951383 n=1 Tax=Corapipo altera TaxID=415028 RepID=UPI000FD67B52|nr:uncharacterized protein LOC113951383 [Corapipo altera]